MHLRTRQKDFKFKRIMEKQNNVRTSYTKEKNNRRRLIIKQIQVRVILDHVTDRLVKSTVPMSDSRYALICAKRDGRSMTNVARSFNFQNFPQGMYEGLIWEQLPHLSKKYSSKRPATVVEAFEIAH